MIPIRNLDIAVIGDEELVNAVLAAAQEAGGKMKLACADAFRIAADFGVPPGEVGRICNGRNIKLAQCQLGCF